jgi:hypothetical protein
MIYHQRTATAVRAPTDLKVRPDTEKPRRGTTNREPVEETRHNSGAGSPREAATRTACLRAKTVEQEAAASCPRENANVTSGHTENRGRGAETSEPNTATKKNNPLGRRRTTREKTATGHSPAAHCARCLSEKWQRVTLSRRRRRIGTRRRRGLRGRQLLSRRESCRKKTREHRRLTHDENTGGGAIWDEKTGAAKETQHKKTRHSLKLGLDGGGARPRFGRNRRANPSATGGRIRATAAQESASPSS